MAARFLLVVLVITTFFAPLYAKVLEGTGGVSITVTQPLAPFDGSVASAPTGSMTNTSGTWTFGTTTNGCGDYTVSLNGTAISQTGVAVEQLNGNTYLYSVCSGPWWSYNATSHVFTNIGQAAPHQFTVPAQPIWMTFSAPACANPVTVPCFNGTLYEAPDNTQGGVALAAVTTVNSDGSSFSGTLTNSPNTTLSTVNAPYNVTAARAFLSTDDNIAYPTTITATPTMGPVIASTALSSNTFVAQAGNALRTIGTLSSAVASFGQSNPSYSLLTTCGVQCADSSLFAVSGKTLKIGSSDITVARNYAVTVVDTESAQNSPFSQSLTIAGQLPSQTITSVSLNGGTNVGTFTGSSASYAGVGPVAIACSDTCSGVTTSLSTTTGGCTATNGAGNSSFFMTASDGSIISQGTGSLLTVEGTWGFGAANGADWYLSLNGVVNTSTFAVSLEIINGNLYQVNHLNTWYLRNTTTHSWSQVAAPTEAMPAAAQTLVVKPNIAGGTYNVCVVATATGYSNSPKSGTFVITGSGGGAQPTLTGVSLNGGTTGSFTAPPASSIGVGPIVVTCSNGPCTGITDLLSTSQSVCNATNGANNSSFFMTSADGSIVNAPSTSTLLTSEGTWTFDGTAADGVDSFIQLNGTNTGWGVILQITNGDLYSKNQVTGQWYHRTGGAWTNIGSTAPAQASAQTPQTLVANANVPIGTYKVCVAATGSAYANSPLGAAFTVTGTGFVTSAVCTPTGTQAQADATKAGFNTCALGNDFTVMIPNTVGTGLPSNWLDCALDGDTSAVWHLGFIGSSSQVTVPPCSGHVAWNATDTGGGGNLALQFTLSDSDVTTFTNPAVSMQTQNKSNTNPVPGPGQFGYAYYEWTFRTDSNVAVNNAFWSWVGPNAGTLAGQSTDLVELDFTENLGLNRSQEAWNRWVGSTDVDPHVLFSNVGLPFTSYHTWAALFTGDGGSNFSMCGYVDGVRQACATGVYDGANENLQRRFLIAWIQYLSGSIGTVHQYIKQIKVLTCANWQQSGPAGMCPGTTFNGDFYQ